MDPTVLSVLLHIQTMESTGVYEGEDLNAEMASGREQMWEVEGMCAEVSVGEGRLHLEYLTLPTGAFFLTSVISCLFSKFSNGEITSAGARKM